MTIIRSQILKDISNKVQVAPEPPQATNTFDNLKDILDLSEIYLKYLQELHDNLSYMKEVHKADVLSLMKNIRKVYTALNIYEDISTVWPYIRDNMNNPSVTFDGASLTAMLLINKNIIVLNRNIFTTRQRLEALLRNNRNSVWMD